MVERQTSEKIWDHRFWRNRKGEAVYVQLKRFTNGAHIVDLRIFFTAADGTMRPTTKGVCLNINRLSDLKGAVDKAFAAAAGHGLIKDEGTK